MNLPPTPPPSLKPEAIPVYADAPAISVVSMRVPAPGEVVPNALSVPPGTTVTVPGVAPAWWAQLLAVAPDVAAIVVVGQLIVAGRMSGLEGMGFIVAVLTARLPTYKLGESARSGILTILMGALGDRTAAAPRVSPPPAPKGGTP